MYTYVCMYTDTYQISSQRNYFKYHFINYYKNNIHI